MVRCGLRRQRGFATEASACIQINAVGTDEPESVRVRNPRVESVLRWERDAAQLDGVARSLDEPYLRRSRRLRRRAGRRTGRKNFDQRSC
jgi:hypothetical protein